MTRPYPGRPRSHPEGRNGQVVAGDVGSVSPSALPATLLPPLLMTALLTAGTAVGPAGSPRDEPPQQVTVTSVPDATSR